MFIVLAVLNIHGPSAYAGAPNEVTPMPSQVPQTTSVVASNSLPSGVSSQDVSYLQGSFLANLSEINEAPIVEAKSTDPAAKEFALWMITDHTPLTPGVVAMANQLGVALPTSFSPAQQAELATLAQQSGAQLNQTYAVDEVADHQQSVVTQAQEVQTGSNPALVAMAQQLLPVLERHLNGAVTLSASEGVGSPGSRFPLTPTAPQPPGAPLGTPSAQDVAFVQAASQANMEEIAQGQLAQQQSGSPTAAIFGQWMMGDHSAASATLQTLAAQESVSVPTTLDTAHAAELATLQPLQDGAFSQTYATAAVGDHAQSLMTFLHEAESGSDPALVSFAQETLPTLVQHLQGALMLAQTEPGGASANATLSTMLVNVVQGFQGYGNQALLQDVTQVADLQPGVSALLAQQGSSTPPQGASGAGAYLTTSPSSTAMPMLTQQ